MEIQILKFILNSIDESLNLVMLGEEISALRDTLVLILIINKSSNSPVLFKILEYIDMSDCNFKLGYVIKYKRDVIFNRYTSILDDFIEIT
jgi:hypothetical protein